MRITNNLLIERFLRVHREIMESLEKASYQISTGKRLEQPSDDPSSAAQILTLKRSIEEMNRFLKNMDVANSWLSAADTAFDKLDGYVSRVRELAVQGANDTQNAESRAAIAKELNQIFSELLDIGNTQSMGKYIFAGTKSDKKPFAYNKYNSVRIKYFPPDITDTVKVETAQQFSDLYQMDSGRYRLYLKREGSGVKVWLEDENGRVVQIDSNGSDDSGLSSNVFADSAVFTPSVVGNKLYGTFDTGRGIKVELNGVELNKFDSVKVIEFDYTKGGEITYTGNGEEQFVQVGYNNRVAMNVPGEGLFKPTHRTIAAQSSNSELSEALPFDRLSVATGDVFEVNGLTHDGRVAGAAYVVAPQAVDFNGLGTVTTSLTLKFNINEGGTIYSSQITLNLPAHYDDIQQVVDVLKAQLDANSVLRDRVEVGAQGDHIVFHLTKPGNNYLFVKEVGTNYLGFGDGIGEWGIDAKYVVSQRVEGRAQGPVTAASTFTITTVTGSVTVSVDSTETASPLYTVEKIKPRLYDRITAGETIDVTVGTASYTLQFSSDVTTLEDLLNQWNDATNWTASAGATVPPVVMVQDGDSSYRLISMVDTDEIDFSNGGSEPTLYELGLASTTSGSYTLSHEPFMSSDEFTALRIAYHIKSALPRNTFKVRTDGAGGIEVVDERGLFTMDFPATSAVAKVFAKKRNPDGTYTATSEIDTVKDLINRVEEIYRHHVEGYVADGMLYFRDRQGGISQFSLDLRASGRASPFSSFFVVREGGGEDIFDVVKDIEEASAENIPRRMIGKPSQWESVERGRPLQTEILPMTTGKFAGDYNTTWHVKVDVMMDDGTGTPEIVGEGLTSFFAKQEATITTSSVTLNLASGTMVFHKSNGEEESRVVSGSVTLNGTSGSSYRIYLEDGTMTVNSASGTISIDGDVVIAVEDGTASYDDISDIKYVKYSGHIDISGLADRVHSVDEDLKTNLLVTVTDSQGRVVKSLVVKDPYKPYYVRDGVYLSFGTGEVISGDSFEVKVGSGIEEKIGRLDEAYQQILTKRTEVGARVEGLKLAKNRYQAYVKDAKERKAPLEDVDIAEATVQLQKAQMALQGALLSSLRLFNLTLLDFMR